MAKFFLIKEHNYEKIDGKFYGKDTKLLPGGHNSYGEAIACAKEQNIQPEDVVYVVEVVAQRFGFSKVT